MKNVPKISSIEIVFGRVSAPDPVGELTMLPRPPVGWGGEGILLPSPTN